MALVVNKIMSRTTHYSGYNRCGLPLATIALLLPLVAYFGLYYANLRSRFDPRGTALDCGVLEPHPRAARPIFTTKYIRHYRLYENQSKAIFWPAERVDDMIRR